MSSLDTLPAAQEGIVGNAHGSSEYSRAVPVPDLQADMVMIRTVAVSVNPVDTKMVDSYVTEGAILGCDMAGVVVAVGPDAAAKHLIAEGDRVAATLMGMNPLEPGLGAFCEYVATRPDVGLVKLSPDVSFEQGCSMGTTFNTAGLALFQSLGLSQRAFQGLAVNKTEKSKDRTIPVLVYGGSTATGTAAIQLLKLAGYQPVATCSPRNFDLVRSYGAETVFDYNAPDVSAQIKTHTKNELAYALDCITTVASMRVCYAALGRAGGRYTSLDPYPETVAATRKIVKAGWVLGPVMLGRDIGWPEPHNRKADPEMFQFGVQWRDTLQKLLDEGFICEHPLEMRGGGFEQVLKGMEDIREKRISGKKLVYRISSSPP